MSLRVGRRGARSRRPALAPGLGFEREFVKAARLPLRAREDWPRAPRGGTGGPDGRASLEEALEGLVAEELLTPELLPVGRGSHVLATEVGDEVLLYETRLGRAVRLDRVAAGVWSMCDGRTVRCIC